MKTPTQLKQQIQKKWQSYGFHKTWLEQELASTFDPTLNKYRCPFSLPLAKITDKQMLHQFSEVSDWIEKLRHYQIKNSQYFTIVWKEVNFRRLGKQKVPLAITFQSIECLARYLGQWQHWQTFTVQARLTMEQEPALLGFLQQQIKLFMEHLAIWPKLLTIADYFSQHPRPNCYLRELTIKGIDTKFIEKHKSILKKILDHMLPEHAINHNIDKLTEHGFEKRFGLKFPQPRIRFRLLDDNMKDDIGGLTDIEVTVDEFARLELLCDKVFITENKVNGLAFPQVNNAIVIFGLGYGINLLKDIAWLQQCRLFYWGDIDTHGFAILSQTRHYFPKIKSFLMDEKTLLACKVFWGQEPENKRHQAKELPLLTTAEQTLYLRLKSDYFQPCLRLEQERIPFQYWQHFLAS